MRFNEYQQLAARTMPKNKGEKELLNNMQMGLSGESGEIADHMKKAWYQGHELSHEEIKKELGDLLWYISLGATALNCNLEEIASMNIEKLKKRYPNGFDADKSINRVE